MTMIPREMLRLGGRIVMSGVLSDRPQACPSADGCLYLATDEDGGTLYRCDGSAWAKAAAGAAENKGEFSITLIALADEQAI